MYTCMTGETSKLPLRRKVAVGRYCEEGECERWLVGWSCEEGECERWLVGWSCEEGECEGECERWSVGLVWIQCQLPSLAELPNAASPLSEEKRQVEQYRVIQSTGVRQ